jgi:hypothetical protein
LAHDAPKGHSDRLKDDTYSLGGSRLRAALLTLRGGYDTHFRLASRLRFPFLPSGRPGLVSGLLAVLSMSLLMLSPPSYAAEPEPEPPDPVLSTLTFRDAFLPPGAPSVALRADETAILWNPAGIAMSNVYYLSYAWKGTYYDDDLKIQSHYVLTKSRGFGIGFMRDDFSKGVETTTLFTIAPPITRKFALGWTGKWKGGFNFDAGLMALLGRHIAFGFVGRNIRYRPGVRRYWESGIAFHAVPGRLTCHFDVVVEDSPWRAATGLGGGFYLNLDKGVSITASYFTDGEGHGITRAGLRLRLPGNTLEGEYTQYTNDFQTMGVRLATRNP